VIRLAALLVALALALAGCGTAEEPADPAEPATAAAAATAVVVCGADGASVATPEVAAGRNGVRVEIRNETDAERVVHVQSAGLVQGEGFPVGTHTRVWALPPGPATVTCDETAGDPGEEDGAAFEVVDPDGLWVSTELDCDEVSVAMPDYEAGTPGSKGEPADVVRSGTDVPLEESDVVEPAGYPGLEDAPVVRIVRDGRVVGTVTLMPTEDGGWLVSTVTRCADA
jgi:hypothetical protein